MIQPTEKPNKRTRYKRKCGIRSFFFLASQMDPFYSELMPSDITRLLNHGIIANSEYAVPVDVTQTPPSTTVILGPCRDISTMVLLEKIEIPTAFSFLFTVWFPLQHGSNVCLMYVVRMREFIFSSAPLYLIIFRSTVHPKVG